MERYKPKGNRKQFMLLLAFILFIAIIVIYESYQHFFYNLLIYFFGK